MKRIEDVRLLRARQFSEDSGPMAHPVRPASYQKIDNFYTMTVRPLLAVTAHVRSTLLRCDAPRARAVAVRLSLVTGV